MKYLVVGAMALAVFAAAPASAESMQIAPNGSRSSAKGPSQYFTGSVTVDPLYAANESTSSSGGLVAFEPGARSAWHTHPGGQFLDRHVRDRMGAGGRRPEARDQAR